ncbi:TetR/AcrR family transcriptional regulator [Mycobacterium deserti]|uniref:TetR/AcrR family transcriptional regulator n=1 Tax=Mycobacterium deserti TaxID=2978347 RepID=A0ABT2MHG3_9MYCO|nr:TetR/AcrR family transcriptional regulator [Mycobacterium deserti]MCT7661712.1 TetR/AcrR family transcriptional regulator [Mycobacterium deserti]
MEQASRPIRSAHKRQTILEAGRQLFLRHGYGGTSMDQVAASAEVSKQTVYKHFGEKRALLFAIVAHEMESVVAVFGRRVGQLAETDDIEAGLTALAMQYLRAVLDDHLVQLRRLVISEAHRLPELAEFYYDNAPARTLATLADAFARLHDRGILHAPEPAAAAEHFAFLVIGRPMDQALFYGAAPVLARLDVGAHARAAVEVFLAAHRPERR